MRRNNVYKLCAAVPFCIAEIVLSVLIQTTNGRLCNTLSYLSVALAAAFALGTLAVGWGRSDNLIRLGLGFTLIADYCLVLAEPTNEPAGVAVFCLTQLSYFAALFLEENRRLRTVNVAIRLGLIAVVIPAAFLVLGSDTDALAVLSVFYYANLVANMILAFADFKRRGIFAIGLLCFALCDVTLGLGYLGSAYLGAAKGSFLYWIGHTGLNLPWVFYVPSQVLIALHLLISKDKKEC